MADEFLAVDFGADSGRVMLARLDAGRVSLQELHRFPNKPLKVGDSIRWDLDELFRQVLQGLTKAAEMGAKPKAISCDSWGVDYGFVDEAGQLLEPAYCYRDKRTENEMARFLSKIPQERIYGETGIQFMQFNTLFQLDVAARDNSGSMGRASKFIFIADLINLWLGGSPVVDQSNASTSQLMDPRGMSWSHTLTDAAGIPRTILPDIVPCGTRTGTLKPELQKQTGLGPCDIITTCSHDTAAAVAAVPSSGGEDWAYLSCGTWSLLGAELSAPIINTDALDANYTNEVGLGGTIRFLKNITGLWIIQECRRDWESKGMSYTYGQLTEEASKAPAFLGLIYPDHPAFAEPGHMPDKVQSFLGDTAQRSASTPGEIVRIAMESLALRYRQAIEQLEGLSGRTFSKLHMVGGGIQAEMLCQFTANAIGRPVFAGPVEATAIGNALTQALACGCLRDHAHLREVVAASFPPKIYQPSDRDVWEHAYREYSHIVASL